MKSSILLLAVVQSSSKWFQSDFSQIRPRNVTSTWQECFHSGRHSCNVTVEEVSVEIKFGKSKLGSKVKGKVFFSKTGDAPPQVDLFKKESKLKGCKVDLRMSFDQSDHFEIIFRNFTEDCRGEYCLNVFDGERSEKVKFTADTCYGDHAYSVYELEDHPRAGSSLARCQSNMGELCYDPLLNEYSCNCPEDRRGKDCGVLLVNPFLKGLWPDIEHPDEKKGAVNFTAILIPTAIVLLITTVAVIICVWKAKQRQIMARSKNIVTNDEFVLLQNTKQLTAENED